VGLKLGVKLRTVMGNCELRNVDFFDICCFCSICAFWQFCGDTKQNLTGTQNLPGTQILTFVINEGTKARAVEVQ
jgi:hypothetical protein